MHSRKNVLLRVQKCAFIVFVKIVKKAGIGKVRVISGIGVRPYYRNLGYELEGSYMVKGLV